MLRLEALRDLFAAPPSTEGWARLLDLLGKASPKGEERRVALEYAQEHLQSWPDALRAARWPWVQAGDHPLLPLCRCLDTGQLNSRKLGPDGAAALAASPCLSSFTQLRLFNSKLGDAGITALAASPHLTALTHLELGVNKITAAGAAALVAAPWIGGVIHLDLSGNNLRAAAAEALAAAPQLASLRSLDLRDNPLGDRGARALAASPHLAALERLRLETSALATPTRDLLACRFGDALR